MRCDMVIWLIGISGAGKTTLGLKLKDYFEKEHGACCMIDGDEVRFLFDNDLGYGKSDREANIKRIILAAYMLDKCEIYTIVCNISPFEHLRELCRKKISGYNEIYLRKKIDVSVKNDVKNIYKSNLGKTDVIGVDIKFDEPKSPALVIDVDNETVDESFHKIINYIHTTRKDIC
jgi:adenylylsulfate kinase